MIFGSVEPAIEVGERIVINVLGSLRAGEVVNVIEDKVEAQSNSPLYTAEMIIINYVIALRDKEYTHVSTLNYLKIPKSIDGALAMYRYIESMLELYPDAVMGTLNQFQLFKDLVYLE